MQQKSILQRDLGNFDTEIVILWNILFPELIVLLHESIAKTQSASGTTRDRCYHSGQLLKSAKNEFMSQRCSFLNILFPEIAALFQQSEIMAVIVVSPVCNKTGHYWEIWSSRQHKYLATETPLFRRWLLCS